MARLLLPPDALRRLIRRRRRIGADRKDEVWDGTYVMSPNPDNEHQELAGLLVHAFLLGIPRHQNAKVYPGANVSDREEHWKRNYRCPDVLVFLPGNPARDRGSHWLGGPDLAVEIVSPHDRSRKKLSFYARVGTREVLFVDRDPWGLELYALRAGKMESLGVVRPGDGLYLTSEVLGLRMRLLDVPARPVVELSRHDASASWTA